MTKSFQARVVDWATRCFGSNVVQDKRERAFRFAEEAIELMQTAGIARDDVERLIEYVYSRPPGDFDTESGGTLTTLAVLCEAHGRSMMFTGEAELIRIEGLIKKIQAKHRSKTVKSSPLPGKSDADPT